MDNTPRPAGTVSNCSLPSASVKNLNVARIVIDDSFLLERDGSHRANHLSRRGRWPGTLNCKFSVIKSPSYRSLRPLLSCRLQVCFIRLAARTKRLNFKRNLLRPPVEKYA